MSEANAPVRLQYRHVPLAEPPAVKVLPDGVFVALAAPPPVRTVLRIEHEDGTARALEVTRIVEVEGSDERGERGFYARWVSDDVLAASSRVGSEHLRSVESRAGTAPNTETTGEDAPSDAGHVAMAMPAPVVVDEDEDDDDDDASAPDDGSDDGSDESSESGPEGEDASANRRGRARKRRAKKPRK